MVSFVYIAEQLGTEQIFYFRTYTKYIVTIQLYIFNYMCHIWYWL